MVLPPAVLQHSSQGVRRKPSRCPKRPDRRCQGQSVPSSSNSKTSRWWTPMMAKAEQRQQQQVGDWPSSDTETRRLPLAAFDLRVEPAVHGQTPPRSVHGRGLMHLSDRKVRHRVANPVAPSGDRSGERRRRRRRRRRARFLSSRSVPA